VVRDVVQRDVEPALCEQLSGGTKQPLAIDRGVSSQATSWCLFHDHHHTT
jgi:hypothetical protein